MGVRRFRLERTHLKKSLSLALSSPETGPNFDSFDGVSPTRRSIKDCAISAVGLLKIIETTIAATRAPGTSVFRFILRVLAPTIHERGCVLATKVTCQGSEEFPPRTFDITG